MPITSWIRRSEAKMAQKKSRTSPMCAICVLKSIYRVQAFPNMPITKKGTTMAPTTWPTPANSEKSSRRGQSEYSTDGCNSSESFVNQSHGMPSSCSPVEEMDEMSFIRLIKFIRGTNVQSTLAQIIRKHVPVAYTLAFHKSLPPQAFNDQLP